MLKQLAPLAYLLVILTGCATSSAPGDADYGSHVISRNAVVHEGPELVAAVAYLQGNSSVADEYLVLGVEFSGARGGRPLVIDRNDITLRTPDGRRLPLLSENDYRAAFPKLRITIQRTMAFLPLLHLSHPTQVGCGRWFLATEFADLTYDQIPVNSLGVCSGPLVFGVQGGVQPGRWRLVIELEESIADIPFEIELDQ
ncbi:MAG: hypothetical protein P8Y93_08435 [Acidobacteriota bacterium]